MEVEFTCEGCGLNVVLIAGDMPRHRFCAVCAWVSEFVDPSRIMEVRRQVEPGGWEKEPHH